MILVGIMTIRNSVVYHLSENRDLMGPRLCELRNLESTGHVRIDVDDPHSLMFELMMEVTQANKWYSDWARGLSVAGLVDRSCPECLKCIGIDMETIRRLREL